MSEFYEDVQVTITERRLLSRVHELEDLFEEKVNNLFAAQGSPYVYHSLRIGDYPKSLTIKLKDDVDSQPDEDDMCLDNEGYKAWSLLCKELEEISGARRVCVPSWYWSK